MCCTTRHGTARQGYRHSNQRHKDVKGRKSGETEETSFLTAAPYTRMVKERKKEKKKGRKDERKQDGENSG